MAASVITRASLVDNVTLWSAATVNSAVYDAIDSMFGGAGSYTTFEFGGALKVTGALTPVTNDGAAIGSGAVSWADLFLASGGVVNFNNGDVTVTHSANTLTFAGASTGYTFADGPVTVALGAVGTPSLTFSGDLNTGIWSPAADTIAASTGGTERMRIDTSGNVGIGVTPGTVKLDIVGLTDVIRVGSNATNATTKESKWLLRHYTNAEEDVMFAYVYSTSTANEIYIGGGASAQNAATQISFSTAANNTTVAGTERLRITSGGNIAIGATARFYLDGVAATGDTYIEENSANNVRIVAGGQLAAQFKSDVVELYGAGSQYKFDSGACYPANDNARNLGGTSNRWAAVYAANGTIQTSDRTRKRDISDETLGLDFVLRLKPVSFVMHDEADEARRHGLIAQDVIEAAQGAPLAGILSGARDGDYGLNYAGFVPALIRAVHEQQAEIDALKARLN